MEAVYRGCKQANVEATTCARARARIWCPCGLTNQLVPAVDVTPDERYLITLQHQVTNMVDLLNWRGFAVGSTCVVGLQWGDEAKGKIVDLLCDRHDVVVRYQGGANAGHTVVVDGMTFKLSLVPTGILRPGVNAVVGNGVVIHPPALLKEIDTLAAQGFRGITISYDVWPDQFDVILGEARRRGLATLGEPGFTSYPYAIRAGVDTLPHDDHFTFELAPALAQLTRADNLVANREAVRAVCAVDPTSDEATAYGGQLANSHTTLMPTLAMEATADLLDVPNPWNARSSVLIDAADIDTPTDKATGASAYLASAAPERREVIRKCAWHKEALDARFYRLGARFLAGSNAGSYGSLPGSGLHLELALLHRIGLSPREALAAATTNYADVYGWQDVGRIEPGRVADLLILDADPRADLSALEHIHTLVFRGKVVDREKLLTLDGRPAAP